VKEFSLRPNTVNAVNKPSSDGTVPVKELELRFQ
jgi:hypothetical protein